MGKYLSSKCSLNVSIPGLESMSPQRSWVEASRYWDSSTHCLPTTTPPPPQPLLESLVHSRSSINGVN